MITIDATLLKRTGIAIVATEDSPAAGTNERQRVALPFGVDGGSFTIGYGGTSTAPIAFNATAAEVGVSVTDQGPGFSGEILPRAFEPLHTTKAVGTGLGLALCRAIVEAHGGTIEARNLDSRGACVTFRIPRRSAFPA